MYRAAASRFRSLKGHSNHGLYRFASSSAVASKHKSSGGFFGWFVGDHSTLPPLDFPLSDVNLPPPLPDYVEPSKIKITTLPNGVRVASETSPTPETFGSTHLLECMAFKSTRNRSHLRVVREVEEVGGNVLASAAREQMGYIFNALKSHVPEMVELLVDCVRNPVFLDWEVNEQLSRVTDEIIEASNNPHGLLLEAIHAAGYSGALANSLLAPESAINNLSGTILEKFVSENYTASRIVLAASGVEHVELLSFAEPLLSDLPSAPCEEPKSVYNGGDYRHQGDSGDGRTHFALAFELPGDWHKEKDALQVEGPSQLVDLKRGCTLGCVLNEVSTDPIDFSIQQYLQQYWPIWHPSSYSSELLAIATPGKVEQVQLNRAKQSTKSAVLMNFESRVVSSEDIGRQVLTYGARKPVEHFLKVVDEVTMQDIASIAEKLLSSPLTMASYGDVILVPSYDSISSKFKSK